MNEKNIIIGNGLIAKELSSQEFGRACLILASGVSNSQEVNPKEFERESALVEYMIDLYPKLHVLYCSTCNATSSQKTPYIQHKLAMEAKVLSKANSCHIFRLPQVVGQVNNRTLVSYFVESILRDRVLRIQGQATRNLLDVEDFSRIASMLVRKNISNNKPLNIASSKNVFVIDIIKEIGKILNKELQFEIEDSGNNESIDIDFLKNFLETTDCIFRNDYWRIVLRRYVPLISFNLKRVNY